MTSALSTSATELVPEPRQCMAISPHTPEQLFEIGDRFVAVDVAHDFRRLRMCSAVGVRAVFTAALAALRTGNTGEIRRVSVTEYWQRGVLTPIPSMPTVAVLRPPESTASTPKAVRSRRRSCAGSPAPESSPAPSRCTCPAATSAASYQLAREMSAVVPATSPTTTTPIRPQHHRSAGCFTYTRLRFGRTGMEQEARHVQLSARSSLALDSWSSACVGAAIWWKRGCSSSNV